MPGTRGRQGREGAGEEDAAVAPRAARRGALRGRGVTGQTTREDDFVELDEEGKPKKAAGKKKKAGRKPAARPVQKVT